MERLSKTQEQTRRNFIDSFLKLYMETPIHKISIKTLADEAGYNRSSFYLYFPDIYGLAEAAEEDVINRITTEVGAYFSSKTETPLLQEVMVYLAEIASHYVEIFYALRASSTFKSKFMEALRPYFFRLYRIDREWKYADYVLAFVMNAMLQNAEYWYQHRDEITLQEAVTIAQRLMTPGLQSFAGKQE